MYAAWLGRVRTGSTRSRALWGCGSLLLACATLFLCWAFTDAGLRSAGVLPTLTPTTTPTSTPNCHSDAPTHRNGRSYKYDRSITNALAGAHVHPYPIAHGHASAHSHKYGRCATY